jgi:hypothetical protein
LKVENGGYGGTFEIRLCIKRLMVDRKLRVCLDKVTEALDRLEALEDEGDPTVGLPRDYSPLDYILAVMRDPRQPAWRRDRAARDAAPYCHPRLAVTAITTPVGFAQRLDEAIARSERAKVIDATPPAQIEARPDRQVRNPLPPSGPTPTRAGARFATLRRI